MVKKPRIWLGLLLVWMFAYHAAVAFAGIDELLHGEAKPASPLSFGVPMNVVSDLSPEAYDSGVRDGDILERIDGKPFDSMRVLFESLNRHKPGGVLPATVRSAKGTEFDVNIRILPLAAQSPTTFVWLIELTVAIGVPLFCLSLGFWIAFLRPNDRLSWLLLAMMIGFSGIAQDFPIAALPSSLFMLMFWALFASSFGLWTVWIMLFAILFPKPTRFDGRLPWLKWIWVAPPVLLTLTMALFELSREANFQLMAFAVPFVRQLLANRSDTFIPFCAVIFFFVVVGLKSITCDSPDGRRRLRILWMGGVLGCTPVLVQSVRALLSGSDVLQWAGPIEYFATFLPLLLFPLTLTYVFIIRRAMDVRATIRHGIQFALVERGFIALELTVATGVIAAVVLVSLRRDAGLALRIKILAAGALLIVMFRRMAHRLASWIDRHLFRTEYDKEQSLKELTLSLRTLMEENILLETVVERLSVILAVPQLAFLVNKDGELVSTRSTGHETDAPLSLAEAGGIVRYLKVSQQAAPIYFDDVKNWIQTIHPAEQTPVKTTRTEMVIPISGKHQLLGVLALGRRKGEAPYTKRDLRLLDALAIQAGFALENSRLAKQIAQSESPRTSNARPKAKADNAQQP